MSSLRRSLVNFYLVHTLPVSRLFSSAVSCFKPFSISIFFISFCPSLLSIFPGAYLDQTFVNWRYFPFSPLLPGSNFCQLAIFSILPGATYLDQTFGKWLIFPFCQPLSGSNLCQLLLFSSPFCPFLPGSTFVNCFFYPLFVRSYLDQKSETE